MNAKKEFWFFSFYTVFLWTLYLILPFDGKEIDWNFGVLLITFFSFALYNLVWFAPVMIILLIGTRYYKKLNQNFFFLFGLHLVFMGILPWVRENPLGGYGPLTTILIHGGFILIWFAGDALWFKENSEKGDLNHQE